MKNIVELKEEVKLKQEDYDVILEKGDRIQVLKEAKPSKMRVNPARASLEKDVSSISNLLSNMIYTAGNNFQTKSLVQILNSIKNKVDDLIIPYF